MSIEYGRPSLKGRVPGKDIDPYDGREWRTGADEATTLKTDKALKFGNLAVPAGTYTLYTIPDRRHLASGDQQEDRPVGHPLSEGRRPRPRADDARQGAGGRGEADHPVQDTPAGGTLHIDWGTTRASIPFTVG